MRVLNNPNANFQELYFSDHLQFTSRLLPVMLNIVNLHMLWLRGICLYRRPSSLFNRIFNEYQGWLSLLFSALDQYHG